MDFASTVMDSPSIGVDDLYVDLAISRAAAAHEELRQEAPASPAELFLEAADLLEHAAAMLAYTADVFSAAGPQFEKRLQRLAMSLVAEAAGYELAADMARGAEGPAEGPAEA